MANMSNMSSANHLALNLANTLWKLHVSSALSFHFSHENKSLELDSWLLCESSLCLVAQVVQCFLYVSNLAKVIDAKQRLQSFPILCTWCSCFLRSSAAAVAPVASNISIERLPWLQKWHHFKDHQRSLSVARGLCLRRNSAESCSGCWLNSPIPSTSAWPDTQMQLCYQKEGQNISDIWVLQFQLVRQSSVSESSKSAWSIEPQAVWSSRTRSLTILPKEVTWSHELRQAPEESFSFCST